jgi:hypothetical protein
MAGNWLAKAKMAPRHGGTASEKYLFTPTFYAVVRHLSGNASSQKGRIDAPNPQPDYGPQQPAALRQRANAVTLYQAVEDFRPVALNQKPKFTGANFGHRK